MTTVLKLSFHEQQNEKEIFLNFYHPLTNLTYVGMVESHVCILQERYDPLSRAKLWAIPQNEGMSVPRSCCATNVRYKPKLSQTQGYR